MLAKYENRLSNNEKVWVGKWLNLKNNAHWHDETEIVFCQSGMITVETQDVSITLTGGEGVFLEGGLAHKIFSEEGAVCLTVLIHVSIVSEVAGAYHLEGRKLQNCYQIDDFYSKIKQLQAKNNLFTTHALAAMATLLLTQIFSNESITKEQQLPLKNNRYELFKDILKTVENDYAFVTFKDMCQKFGYSPAHFSRLFLQFTGTTFTKYLTSIKISKAVNLLQSDANLSMTEIATCCGFSSIRNFNRYFKQYTGLTPKKLPKHYTFPIDSFKLYGTPLDPTSKTSILLD